MASSSPKGDSVTSQKALRLALEPLGWRYSKGTISKLVREAWWPGGAGGPWSPSACAQALRRNRRAKSAPAQEEARGKDTRQRAQRAGGGKRAPGLPDEPTAHDAEAPAPAPRADYSEEDLQAIGGSGSGDPLEILRAAAKLSGQTLEAGLRTGKSGARDVSDLKTILAELRQAEAAWTDLRERQGQLVDREHVIALAADLGRRRARFLEQVLGVFTLRVEEWIHDEDHRAAPEELRLRTYREWWEAETRALLEAEARVIEDLLGGAA